MAQMWFGSLVPWTDPSGDPYVGAAVEFFNSGTTTPQVVYTDSSLSTAAGLSARTANAGGRFGALFMNPTPGSYRVKITAADATVIEDVDGISVPQDADFVPPDAGETSVDLLFRTGMLAPYYGTSAPSGWVRSNGRTIGSATSGATERANEDTEDLFLHLWAQDSTLAVSGGRGGTAAGDWAGNKTIALPDLRGRAIVGLDTMGNTAAGILAGIETLGETIGAETVTLTTGQIPTHLHAAGTLLMPNHGHPYRANYDSSAQSNAPGGFMHRKFTDVTQPAYTGTVDGDEGHGIGGSGTASITGSTANAGSGESHSNVQPSKGVTIIIKL